MHSLLKNKFTIIALLTSIILASLAYLNAREKTQPVSNDIIEELITLTNKNTLRVIHSPKAEKGLLFLIADKNKTEANTQYAKQFAELSYYVAIINNQDLLNAGTNSENQCLNLAKELNELSVQLNTQFTLNNADLPILVGIENGAASVYSALAQAEKKTFHAAVGVNFTPQLDTHTLLCDQEKFTVNSNGVTSATLELKSLNRLPTSFYIFQDKNFPTNTVTSAFANSISNAKFTIAKEANETPLSEAIQILQWLDPRLADQISSDASDSDLPLIEVNVPQDKTETTQTMAILLTGDGGWAEIDKELAKILAAQGIPVVGFDSLSYFWKARTPVATSQDIERVITQYLEKWNKKQVILIGYSFGADVLPFIANNLSAEAQQKISLIALLGMGKTAAFEFRLSSWMNADKNPDRLPLLPEIEKMKWANSVCIYGVADSAANCLPTEALGVKAISMSGDHHFDEKYEELVKHIIENQKIL
jgi:type IV secretory pathway VirJ component